MESFFLNDRLKKTDYALEQDYSDMKHFIDYHINVQWTDVHNERDWATASKLDSYIYFYVFSSN